MPRNKSLDSIFLRNFFKENIYFFTLEQPATVEIYLFGHGCATSRWIPLKSEIDDYTQLSSNIKNDLNKLFELAHIYTYFACDDKPFRSASMAQKWAEIRQLATSIYFSAQSAGLLKENFLYPATPSSGSFYV